jgi:class 3 adenylate cyclase/tetratricopeptide (TPR) repeat protein
MGQALCPRCGLWNAATNKHCAQCGGLLVSACASCGSPLPPAAKFCPDCGQPAAARGTSERFESPAAYTPRHLVEKILKSRAAIEGERKHVTVLFADIRGSMELLAGLDPEDARTVLDPVLDVMMEAVHHFEGTVNQVLGDGIMALFGAPIAHEDHAVRASYAALRIRDGLLRHARRAGTDAPVQARVGLNSGEVVVRSIGNDLHMDYSAVGQTTHLAARMEQTANPGAILVSADTFRLIEGYVSARPLGPIPVKGLAVMVEAYELEDRRPVSSRFQVSLNRGLTRFVGRDAEMRQIRSLASRVSRGHGQIVALVGEPGVGKSRLARELAGSDDVRGWTVLTGGAAAFGATTPYLPVVGLIRRYLGLDDRDRPELVLETVRDRLADSGMISPADEAPLLAVLDVPVDDPRWEALQPSERRQRTLEALKRLLFALAQVQPVLVIIEDLQWIDSETQSFLDGLVRVIAASRLLLLVTYRPEYSHGWVNQSIYTQLRVDPLPQDGAAALLDDLLGLGAPLAPLKGYLVERTEGNPLFLEEMVRALIETKVVSGERGAYRLEQPLESIRVPGTVNAVLAARIDRLSSPDKRLLQCAAVIGRHVPLVLLTAIADQDERSMAESLARLQTAELLYETSLPPDAQYTFKHGLTQEVSYSALLQGPRRQLHEKVLEALEALAPASFTDRLERLAYHSYLSARWDKALRYCRQLGQRAAARSAAREAVHSLEQALDAVNHLGGEDRETLEIGVDLRLDLQGALVPLGDLDRMLRHLRDAEQLAERLGDQRRLGRALGCMAHCLWWSGEPHRAVDAGQRGLAIAQGLGDFDLEVVAQVRLGQAFFSLGDYRSAAAVCRANVDALKGYPAGATLGLTAPPAVTSLAFLGRSLALLGQFDEGIAMTEDGVREAKASEHPYGIVMAYWGMGDAHLVRGHLSLAIGAFERALALCRSGGFALMASILARFLGEAYALDGRSSEALKLLEGAVTQLAAMKYVPALPSAHAGLGEAYLLAGHLGEARQAVSRALDLCRAHRQFGTEAYTLCTLGAIEAAQEPPATAAASSAYRAALGLAEERGMRPLAARCRLGLGQLHQKCGDLHTAREQLEEARSSLRERRMDLWCSQAEEGLARLGATAT